MAEQITTAEELDWLRENVGTLVVASDDGPAIVWMGEDQDWHSARAITEDDWARGERALGLSAGVDLDGDPEDLLPLTVLWHDGMNPATHDRQVAERAGAQALRDAADDFPADQWTAQRLRARADSLAPRQDAPGVTYHDCQREPHAAVDCRGDEMRIDHDPSRPAAPGVSVSAEWGVLLDDLGSIDTYETENGARAALADGGTLVRVTTTIERFGVTVTDGGA